jgi:diguanylate cyclase (GGDEF)-like protein
VDPGRVLRRRRSPLQLALGGTLVVLILVVEALIVRAYADVSRTTAIFGRVTFLTGNLVNVRSETLLLYAKLEDQLVHQALHDGLTGLANRTLFTERVEQALDRIGPTDVAVLFIDLDDFKHVNDSLGHAAGDQLLVAAAKRLKSCLRPSDTAARLGGDEFAVLLDGVASPEAAEAVAARVIDSLHQPFALQERTIPIKASVGVAVGRRGVDDADGLLRNADVAMCAAKAGGKDRFELFRPDMHADMLQRLELEAELRHAAERGELVLHYQPIVELGSGRVTRVEALVRWQHPTRGLLSPAEFVPLAEDQGMIGPIGRWVLTEACRQARCWQDRFQACLRCRCTSTCRAGSCSSRA